MLFNSNEFVFFYLPIVAMVFFFVARFGRGVAALWLVVASVFFYGWWNPKYVFLILASIGFNFWQGRSIGRTRLDARMGSRAKILLWIGIAANLVLLGYYKYANFFVDGINHAFGSNFGIADILLPLGISFFTFTQIMFLVDVYRGVAREYSIVNYALFVTYFPHLIAGPLLHHRQVMPQFDDPRTYRLDGANVCAGLSIFAVGLFKKVLLADQFAQYANPVFDAVSRGGQVQLLEAWIGATAYALQIYFDFSGYSDMAIGLSRIFNVALPVNFDSPYRATSIIDFWRRWHMTLSAFLRDYLYIPLGGNRHGPLRRHLNLLVTMLLGGLWHGANWTFVIWGGLHGLFLAANHGWRALRRRLGLPGPSRGGALALLLTFAAVTVAWVPFRSGDLSAAALMLKGMAGLHGISLPAGFQAILSGLDLPGTVFSGVAPVSKLPMTALPAWMMLGLAIVWLLPNTQQCFAAAAAVDGVGMRARMLQWKPNDAFALLTGLAFALSIAYFGRASPFIYFQF